MTIELCDWNLGTVIFLPEIIFQEPKQCHKRYQRHQRKENANKSVSVHGVANEKLKEKLPFLFSHVVHSSLFLIPFVFLSALSTYPSKESIEYGTFNRRLYKVKRSLHIR